MWNAAVQSFDDLDGRTVVGWGGFEWALTGGDDDPPRFEHPDAPFRQLWSLDLVLGDGDRRAVLTRQVDTGWGLEVTAPPAPPGTGSHVRAFVADLPLGDIAVLDVVGDEEVVAEVLIAVDGHRMLLMAGEVQESWGGSLEFVRYDESVLLFQDPSAADRLDWRPPRPPGSGAR